MKKVLLSATLILAFIIYGAHQRQEDASAQIIAPNGIALASPTPTDTPTAAPPTPNLTDTPTSTPSSTVHASATATPSPTPKPTATPTPVPTATPAGKYKNGTYTGSVADAYYGNVQVQTTIQGGKIVSVTFLQYPNDRSTSVRINTQAMPYLQQEAIQAQSANVNGVSGASDTSQAFIQSLSYALNQAK